VWDSPPADLVQQWLPELVAEHAATSAAIDAARLAGAALDDAMPTAPGYPDGPDWASAVQADRKAVAANRKPTKLGGLIGDWPARYGVAHASAGHAVHLIVQWNTGAHTKVTTESIERMRAQEAELLERIEVAALEAVSAADQAGTDDSARLGAAWQHLSTMDAALRAWQPLSAVLGWVLADRAEYNGQPVYAAPWPGQLPPGEIVAQATAIRDPHLRAQLALQREPLRAR
jgi:hypothetical protein